MGSCCLYLHARRNGWILLQSLVHGLFFVMCADYISAIHELHSLTPLEVDQLGVPYSWRARWCQTNRPPRHPVLCMTDCAHSVCATKHTHPAVQMAAAVLFYVFFPSAISLFRVLYPSRRLITAPKKEREKDKEKRKKEKKEKKSCPRSYGPMGDPRPAASIYK